MNPTNKGGESETSVRYLMKAIETCFYHNKIRYKIQFPPP